MSSMLVFLPLLLVLIMHFPGRHPFRQTGFFAVMGMAIFQMFVISTGSLDREFGFLVGINKYFQLGRVHDNLSAMVLFIISLILATTAYVGRATVAKEQERDTFYTLLLLAVTGMNSVSLTNDFFTMYLFIEATTIASFILIALHKTLEGLESCFKYLVMVTVATLLILTSIGLLFLMSGSTSFEAVHRAVVANSDSAFLKLTLGLFLVGILLKCGMIPFHGWVPDAYMAAPAAVSVLFAGVITKAAGIYVILRVISSVIVGNTALLNVLLAIGLVSILLGALGALAQKDLKRMLAYSSISQMGYRLIGAGSGHPLGYAGAVFHFFNHAIFKASLFVNAAAIEQRTGTRDMDALRGLGNRMPVTAVTSVIASLSTAGIPPLSGFWSKVTVLFGCWRGGHYGVTVIGVLSSLLTLAYMLGFQHRVFFRKESENWQNVTEADWGLVAPALLLTALTVGIGLFFPFVINSIILPIGSFL